MFDEISTVCLMKILNIDQLAEYLGRPKSTIYEWVNQKKIPYFKLGKLLMFDQADIDKWLESKKVEAEEIDLTA